MLRLTREQVRAVDRIAVERYHIPSIVLMENAARSASEVAMDMLRRIERPCVEILVGTGNNGGDGLAIARHLHNHGVAVEYATWTVDLKGDALANLRIARSMGISATSLYDADIPMLGKGVDLVIDALVGTGLTRPIEGDLAIVIEACNESALPVLAIDIPSGMDCDSGEPLGACIRATRTVTFVAEKAGFANPASRAFTGEVHIGDIGVPRELIEEAARMASR